LAERDAGNPAIARYAKVGRVLSDDGGLDQAAALQTLIATLDHWTEAMELPRLAAFGMRPADIPQVVANCRGNSMKTNPVVLTDAEVAAILKARL
jgi:alcohol dehydrogenase